MKKKLGSNLMICLLVTITIMIICFSDVVMESVSFSISIWKDNLFPSLFPFFVVSNLLLEYGFIEKISFYLGKFMPKIFHLPKQASFVLLVSLFSGFPSGAKYTTELVNNKVLTRDDGAILLTFTHYSNPLFILGLIGNLILGNRKLAIMILLSHVCSGLIIGFLFRPKNDVLSKIDSYAFKENNNVSFGSSLRKSIFDALETLFLLLGIVTVFLVITTLLEAFIDFSPLVKVIVSGLLEMTQGVKLVSILEYSSLFKTILITCFISFGGLSVHAQVLSIISEAKIKYKYFFLARIMHAILASILVFIFYYLF